MHTIDRAIEASGGIYALARRIDVRYQHIQNWRKRGFVPYNRAKQIEKAIFGAVMRHEFFPDLFEGYEPVHVNYSNKSTHSESLANEQNGH